MLLGIIALVKKHAPVVMHTWMLVAFLVAGRTAVLSGSALLGRVAEAMRKGQAERATRTGVALVLLPR